MSDTRLPAHLEVAALIRATEAAGGFATVLKRGDRDSGVILLLTMQRGGLACLWERLPRLDGRRVFEVVRAQNAEKKEEFDEYVGRRGAQDGDSWLLELNVAEAERLIADFGR